jgi:hypothetical protein
MPEYPRKFTHKSEDHMSFKGFFMTVKTYYYHKHNNMSDEAVFIEHGTSFDTICEAQDRQLEKRRKFTIHTMQEHYEYVLKNFVEFEDAVKLREKMEGKTDEEIIHMMPVAFAWVLSMHLLQQKRQERGSVKPKEAEPESNFMDFGEDPLEIL